MSKTYAGVIVMLLGQFLPWLGLEIANEDLTTAVSVIAQIVGALMAFYGRYRLGGVTVFGGRTD